MIKIDKIIISDKRPSVNNPLDFFKIILRVNVLSSVLPQYSMSHEEQHEVALSVLIYR